jgi:hypothetical protein
MTFCDSQVLCLNLFLAKKSEQERGALLRFLPEKDLKALASGSGAASPALSEKNFLQLIHPDWFSPYLESYSDRDRTLLIAPLFEEQRQALEKRYDLATVQETSDLLNHFVIKKWRSWLLPKNFTLTPLAALRPHPLLSFLSLSKEEAEKTIFILGLHDLAPELKKVIESKLLKDVENALSLSERDSLKRVLKTPSSVQFAPLKLSGWDRDKESLIDVIRSRGLNRLAKALYGTEPSFFWYCTHKLSKKEAAILQKLSIDLKNPKAHQTLIEEIAQSTHFILEGSS